VKKPIPILIEWQEPTVFYLLNADYHKQYQYLERLLGYQALIGRETRTYRHTYRKSNGGYQALIGRETRTKRNTISQPLKGYQALIGRETRTSQANECKEV
jgi:hypothetical protein